MELYPNLQSCRVTIQSERSIIQPPVRLPIDIIQQVQQTIPKPIDFTLGMCVWCAKYTVDVYLYPMLKLPNEQL